MTNANTGATAVNGWTLRFTIPGDTRVTQAWNAVTTQTGAVLTATNASYNAAIPAGGPVSFGFGGTWTNNNANPTSFTLNESACATG